MTHGELDRLTRRQAEVLALVTRGLLNKQIAFELAITEATVKAHVSVILRKLYVRNRQQATVVAKRLYVASTGSSG